MGVYNRYLDHLPSSPLPRAGADHAPSPGGGDRQGARRPSGPGASPSPGASRSGPRLLEGLTGGVGELLGGVLKQFSLDRFDTGDILLVLIILFLLVEGDDLELVITLGLMLLLGLGDDGPEDGT